MSAFLSHLQDVMGAFWPYFALVTFGFLPSEIWRWMAAFVVKGISDESEILVWVRAVASALIAGVVAKLLITPSGALASVPGFWRWGAVFAGVGAFYFFRRSVFAGLIFGEVVLICASYLFKN